MNLYDAIDALKVTANTYLVFVENLVSAGWERHGDRKEHYLADPHCVYGASRYFMKEGELHLVSTSLNIRDGYGMSNIINISERNLITKEENEFDSIEVTAFDTEYTNTLIAKYKEAQVVEVSVMDDEDDMNYFMGLTGDGRAKFERRSDEDRLRPVHETQNLVAIADCEYEVEPMNT